MENIDCRSSLVCRQASASNARLETQLRSCQKDLDEEERDTKTPCIGIFAMLYSKFANTFLKATAAQRYKEARDRTREELLQAASAPATAELNCTN